MIQVTIFIILTVLSVIALAGVLLLSAYRIIQQTRKKTNPQQLIRLKKTALFFAVMMTLNLGLVVVSQFTASTPRITDASRNIPANSIAELTELELNGRKQWISLRGW
ncbi:MAG: alpha/beta hydrolase, partial [Clostridia bacterium]|nr:alpha/beta hydrolase [Clostridia bacterium]